MNATHQEATNKIQRTHKFDRINCDEDVRKFFLFLKENDAFYHLDDDPDDIVWNENLTDDMIFTIGMAHDALWDYCNPWDDKFGYCKIVDASDLDYAVGVEGDGSGETKVK